MTNLAPVIGPSGITSPDYPTILAAKQAEYRAIYGSDIVLTPDSQDGQLVAAEAQAVYDTNMATIAAYNVLSPATAQGAGLSSVVKINGLKRKVATASTANVTVIGVAGTTITNGLIGDNQSLGTKWALPTSVVIPAGGAILVTATCTELGDTSAAPGTLVEILTPTSGWQSASNAAAATLGVPVETDAALRLRQTQSVSRPALTPLQAVKGEVQAVTGVIRAEVYENDTSSIDVDGRPAHTITAVVEGGSLANIAAAIGSKKAPGIPTHGTTSQTWIDPGGQSKTINFYVLAYATITVNITVGALAGYLSSTDDLIKKALAAYISGLDIGADVILTDLYTPAKLSGTAAVQATGLKQEQLDVLRKTFKVNAITIAKAPAAPAASDVAIAFYEAATCAVGNITLTLV